MVTREENESTRTNNHEGHPYTIEFDYDNQCVNTGTICVQVSGQQHYLDETYFFFFNSDVTSPTVGSGAAASMRAGSVETLKMKSK